MLKFIILIILQIISVCLCQSDVVFFGITTSTEVDSGTTTSFNLIVSWNTKQYKCLINANGTQTIEPNTYYGCITVIDAIYIGPLTNNMYEMKISMSNNSDFIRIQSISVKDEDSVLYKINQFCGMSSLDNFEGIPISSRCCLWSGYNYNHFVMGSNQILSTDIVFRSNILSFPGIGTEGCIKHPSGGFCDIINGSVSLIEEIVIFSDNMDDAISTGWTFSGFYDSTITSLNCPNGVNDSNSCARIIDGSMTINIPNISKYNHIKASHKSFGKSYYDNDCTLEYSFDNVSYSKISRYSSVKEISYHIGIFTSYHFYSPDTYNTLYIRFSNIESDCYYEDVIIYAENMDDAIYYDTDNKHESKWTGGNGFEWVTDYHCPLTAWPTSVSCLKLGHGYGYTVRNYSNINQYTNLELSFDMANPYGNGKLDVYYGFDNHGFKKVSSSSNSKSPLAIPPLNTCNEGNTLQIKFVYQSAVYLDNIALYGDLITTAIHTASPTSFPTAPTLSTMLPSDVCEYNHLSPIIETVLFYDNMDNAISTGWVFSGEYDATITALNCPNGIIDKCTRITDGSMTMKITNISHYNYIRPSYKNTSGSSGCYFEYSSDNISYSTFEYSSTYIPNTYNILYIRLGNTGKFKDYCYYDDIAVYAENMDDAIYYDADGYNGAGTMEITGSSECPITYGSCLQFSYGRYLPIATRSYSNMSQYTNLQLSFDMANPYMGEFNIYYSFDNNAFTHLAQFVTHQQTPYSTKPILRIKERIQIPVLNTCVSGNTLNLKFRFHLTSTTSKLFYGYLSNIAIYGDLITTAIPSTSFSTTTPIVSISHSSYPTVPVTPIRTTLPTLPISTTEYGTLHPTFVNPLITTSITSKNAPSGVTEYNTLYPSVSVNSLITRNTTEDHDDKTSVNKSDNADGIISIIIVLVVIIVLVIVIGSVLYCKKFNKHQQNMHHIRLKDDENINSAEMITTKMSDNVNTNNEGVNIVLQDTR